MSLLAFALSFLHLLIDVESNEYCHISKFHTMCRFTENKIPENCTDYQRIDLKMEDKRDILDIHNSLRNFVASGGYITELGAHFPEAAAMNYLRWSDQLAEIAQRWADQCLTDESRDQNRDIEEFSVDQMVIVLEISTKEILPHFSEIFMSKWSKSFDYFRLNDIIDFNSSKVQDIRKYSPLIWDISEYIGCAIITFNNPDMESKSSALILKTVCNYGPSGNLKEPPIYKIGQPCSLCDSRRCDQTYKSLCLLNWKSPFPVGRSKIDEDVRKIMLEKYNMLQNGDECFCEDRFDLDTGSNLERPIYLLTLSVTFFTFKLFLVQIIH